MRLWAPPSSWTCRDCQAPATSRLGQDFHDFPAVIMAACRADMVGTLQLTAVRAFGRADGRKRIVRATHVAAGFGGFLLRNSHDKLGKKRLCGREHPAAKAVSIKQNPVGGKARRGANDSRRRQPNRVQGSNTRRAAKGEVVARTGASEGFSAAPGAFG